MVSRKTTDLVDKSASWLLIVAGLLYGIAGLTGTHYLSQWLASWPTFVMLLYVVFGLSALSKLVMMVMD